MMASSGLRAEQTRTDVPTADTIIFAQVTQARTDVPAG